MSLTSFIFSMFIACGGDTAESDDAADDALWEEISDSDLSKDSDDTAKPDGEFCGDEVIEGETCEGDWTETMCVDEQGVWWWCEESAWTSDKDE